MIGTQYSQKLPIRFRPPMITTPQTKAMAPAVM